MTFASYTNPSMAKNWEFQNQDTPLGARRQRPPRLSLRQARILIGMNTEPAPFELTIPVEPADIDELGHVNNVAYLRWVQDVAVAHWRAIAAVEDQAKLLWVGSILGRRTQPPDWSSFRSRNRCPLAGDRNTER